jgi:hypothetical protein
LDWLKKEATEDKEALKIMEELVISEAKNNAQPSS